MRSRTEERLVDGADGGRIDLPLPVGREEAVLLLLDVGQLRPAEAGDVAGDLLDDRAVTGGEVVDVAVDEVAGPSRQSTQLADPQRDVVAPLIDVLRQLG